MDKIKDLNNLVIDEIYFHSNTNQRVKYISCELRMEGGCPARLFRFITIDIDNYPMALDKESVLLYIKIPLKTKINHLLNNI